MFPLEVLSVCTLEGMTALAVEAKLSTVQQKRPDWHNPKQFRDQVTPVQGCAASSRRLL